MAEAVQAVEVTVMVQWKHSTASSIDLKFVPSQGAPKFARIEVERCRSEAGAEWQVAGTHFKELTGTVGGLQPGTAYMFRARGVTRDFWTAWGPPSADMVTLASTSGSKVESMACTVS